MTKTAKKKIPAYISRILNENNIRLEQCNDGSVDLEWFTWAGEDFLVSLNGDDIPDEFYDYAFHEFDPEEHVSEWLDAKRSGVGGVPSLFTLVDDAEDIESFMHKVADELIDAKLKSEGWMI